MPCVWPPREALAAFGVVAADHAISIEDRQIALTPTKRKRSAEGEPFWHL